MKFGALIPGLLVVVAAIWIGLEVCAALCGPGKDGGDPVPLVSVANRTPASLSVVAHDAVADRLRERVREPRVVDLSFEFVDRTGLRIPGLEATVLDCGEGGDRPVASVCSDEHGEGAVVVQEWQGALQVVIDDRHYVGQAVLNLDDLQDRGSARVLVDRERWSLNGNVTTTEGQPISGASVSLLGKETVSVVTDEFGEFGLDVAATDHARIVVRAEGHGSVAKAVEAPAPGRVSTRVAVTLRPGSVRTARVEDRDGVPVQDALLWEPRKGDRTWRTDEAGLVQLDGLNVSRPLVSMMVGRQGYVTRDFRLDLEQSADLATIVLQRSATVSGQVVAESNSLPLPGVRVVGRSGDDGERTWTRTDDSGRFTLSNVRPGCVSLSASVDGYAVREWTTEVPEAGLEQLMVRLADGGEFAGSLSDPTGLGVADAVVWCFADGERVCSGTTRSDEAGKFVVNTLARMPTHIEVRAAGFEDTRFEVTGAEPAWTMQPLARIGGRVAVSDGPIPDEVTVRILGGLPEKTLRQWNNGLDGVLVAVREGRWECEAPKRSRGNAMIIGISAEGYGEVVSLHVAGDPGSSLSLLPGEARLEVGGVELGQLVRLFRRVDGEPLLVAQEGASEHVAVFRGLATGPFEVQLVDGDEVVATKVVQLGTPWHRLSFR